MNYLKEYTVSQELNRLEETAEVVVDDISTLYAQNQSVILNVAGGNRQYFVASRTATMDPDHGEQTLDCVSLLAFLAKTSPTKSLQFITMTPDEYKQFDYDNTEDYTPYILIGDSFGERGWSLHSIVWVLASRMPAVVILGIPNIWIKQFTVSLGSSYYDAIMELASPFSTVSYSVGGVIFIVPKAILMLASGTAYTPPQNKSRVVSEQVMRSDVPASVRVAGDLGRFIPSRHKGKIWSTNLRTFSLQIGSVTIDEDYYGYDTEETEWASDDFYNGYVWRSMRDDETGIVTSATRIFTKKWWALDIFGERAFEIGEVKETYKGRDDDTLGMYTVLYRRESKVTHHEGVHYSYQSPRETSRKEIVDQMVWKPGATPTFEMYNGLETKKTEYKYSKINDALESQNMAITGAVYTEDDKEYKPLEGLAKDDVANGTVSQRTTNEEITNYAQHTKDSYLVRTQTIRLKSNSKYEADANVQVVQAGGVQGERLQLRKAPILAEATTGYTAPVQEVRLQTPSWESADSVLAYQFFQLSGAVVVRTYEVMGEVNVYLGSPVNLEAIVHHNGLQFPAPTLATAYRPIVTEYRIHKNLLTGEAITQLTVEGKLA